MRSVHCADRAGSEGRAVVPHTTGDWSRNATTVGSGFPSPGGTPWREDRMRSEEQGIALRSQGQRATGVTG